MSEIVQRVAQRRSAAEMPIVQVAFNFQNALSRQVGMNGLQIDVLEAIPNESAKFDLNLTFVLDNMGDPISITNCLLEYSSAAFSEEDARTMIRSYVALLHACYSTRTSHSLGASEKRVGEILAEQGVFGQHLAGDPVP